MAYDPAAMVPYVAVSALIYHTCLTAWLCWSTSQPLLFICSPNPTSAPQKLTNWHTVFESGLLLELRKDQEGDKEEYQRVQRARVEAGGPPPPVVQLREWDGEAAALRAQGLVEELSQPPYRYTPVGICVHQSVLPSLSLACLLP
jgi:hypothetical protein